MSKILVVLSGGQDSTTCLFAALANNDPADVAALTIDYGQRHARELEAARKVAAMAGVTNHEFLGVGSILRGTSPLTNKSEGLEQYKDYDSLPGGLEKTFVPGRNALFMVLAANRAYVAGAKQIMLGLSMEDYGGYPDCREDFVKSMEETLNYGLGFGDADPEDRLSILAPLMHLTKAEEIKLSLTFPGCYHALAYSHTAYDGAYPPVGHDHATLLRQKGFAEAGVPDPLLVRAFLEGAIDHLPEGVNYQTYAGFINQGRDSLVCLAGTQAERDAHLDEILKALEVEVQD